MKLLLRTLFLLFLPASSTFATDLTDAIRLEDEAAIRLHLKEELVNIPGGGYHPLSLAIISGNSALVSKLLNMGADPNQLEVNGKTPLYLSAQYGRIKLLDLLHRHRATRRPHESALYVEEAAVFSGSADVLKKVLELYPKANFAWKWRKRDHEDAWETKSALTYAFRHRYYELADILLEAPLKLDVNQREQYEVSSLHYAASDHRCPLPLLQKLLDRGADPLAGVIEPDLAPSNAIDLAAFHGFQKKIEKLTQGLDDRNGRDVLLKAACIARYRRNEGVSSYLLKKAAAKVEEAQKFCRAQKFRTHRKHWAESKWSRALRNRTSSRHTLDLIPNLSPKLPQGVTSGSLAILAPAELENLSALLFSSLSSNADIVLVERAELDRVSAEASLASFQKRNGFDLQKSLSLLGAENVLILTPGEEGKAILYTLLNAPTGLVTLSGGFRSIELEKEQALSSLSNEIIRGLAVDTTAAKGLVAFTQVPLAAQNMSSREISLAPTLNYLLQASIEDRPDHVLLSRDQMEKLEFENTIVGESRYWRAGWVIDGGYVIQSDGRLTLNLRATPSDRTGSVQTRQTGSLKDLPRLVRHGWYDLYQKISGDGANGSLQPQKLQNREPEQLREQSEWFLNAKLVKEALDLARAASALSDRSETSLEWLLDVYQIYLPITSLTSRSAFPTDVFSRSHQAPRLPESINLELKFNLYRHLDDYLEFSQVLLALSSEKGSGFSGKKFYEYLKTLYTYRMAIEGLQIEADGAQRIGLLDAHIRALLEARLDVFPRGMPSRDYSRMIDQYGYLGRFQRDLLTERILPAVLKSPYLPSLSVLDSGPLFSKLKAQMRDDIKSPVRNEYWKSLISKLPSHPIKSQLSGLLFSLATERTERFALMTSYINYYKIETNLRGNGLTSMHQNVCDFYTCLRDALGCENISAQKPSRRLVQFGFKIPSEQSLSNFLLDYRRLKRSHQDFIRNFHGHLLLDQIAGTTAKFNFEKAEVLITGLVKRREKNLSDGDWIALEKLIRRHRSNAGPVLDSLRKHEIKILKKEGYTHRPEIVDIGNSSSIPNLESLVSLPLPDSMQHYQHRLFRTPRLIDGDDLYLNTNCFSVAEKEDGLKDFKLRNRNLFYRINLRTGKSAVTSSPLTKYGPNIFVAGERYIYAHKPNEKRVIVIEKSTMKTKEFPLPHKAIKGLSEYPLGDRFYLCSLKSNVKQGVGTPTVIFEFEGFKEPEVIVSNFRKPARSPLDRPSFEIREIFSYDGRLIIFHIEDGSGAYTAFNPTERSWSKLDKDQFKRFKKLAPGNLKNRELEARSFDIIGETLILERGLPVSLPGFEKLNPPALNFQFARPETRRSKDGGSIKFSRPSEPASLFSKRSYFIDNRSRRSKNKGLKAWHFCSYKDAFEKNLLQYDILGRWNEKYLVILGNNLSYLPHIWSIDCQTLEAYTQTLLQKN